MGSDALIKIVGPGLKGSNLDPFPYTLMKGCIDIIRPVLTKIVKISLQTATMPQHLKEDLNLNRTPSTLHFVLISGQLRK